MAFKVFIFISINLVVYDINAVFLENIKYLFVQILGSVVGMKLVVVHILILLIYYWLELLLNWTNTARPVII